MATLVKTKRRINSVTSTRKITNAMELVSSVKLRRYKDTMVNGNNYINSMREVMSILNALFEPEPDFLHHATNKDLYIIINSNLGLCANYNNDIFKFVSTLIKKDDEIIPIGLKGYRHFKNLNFKLNEDYVSLNEKINFDDINKFSDFVLNQYLKCKYHKVIIVYMRYVNAITYIPNASILLPLTIPNDKATLLPPIIEPNAKELIKELTPIYIASSIYQAIITSQVSEQASRNAAMKNATDNADDILEKLKLEYNKARQGAITQEITEVVSGSGDY